MVTSGKEVSTINSGLCAETDKGGQRQGRQEGNEARQEGEAAGQEEAEGKEGEGQ